MPMGYTCNIPADCKSPANDGSNRRTYGIVPAVGDGMDSSVPVPAPTSGASTGGINKAGATRRSECDTKNYHGYNGITNTNRNTTDRKRQHSIDTAPSVLTMPCVSQSDSRAVVNTHGRNPNHMPKDICNIASRNDGNGNSTVPMLTNMMHDIHNGESTDTLMYDSPSNMNVSRNCNIAAETMPDCNANNLNADPREHGPNADRAAPIVTESCGSMQGDPLVGKVGNVEPTMGTPAHSDFCPTDIAQSLKFCSWNINGLTQEKLDDQIMGSYLKGFDIILLTETWSERDDSFNLPNFTFYNFPRTHRHALARRNSGGIGVYINDSITEGVDLLNNYKDIIVWIRLRKDAFVFPADIYIGIVYFSPEGSTCIDDDLFMLLQTDIANVPAGSEILICGDFNARTNILADFTDNSVPGNDGDLLDLLPPGEQNNAWVKDILVDKGALVRYNMDKSRANSYGLQLIDLCKSTHLIIFNGRVGSDKGVGSFTRIDTTGKSLVDYVIGTPNMLSLIKSFNIHHKLPESDHVPIEFYLHTSASIVDKLATEHVHDNSLSEWETQYKYKWSSHELHELEPTLLDDVSQFFREQFVDSIINRASTSEVASHFSHYFTQACQRIFRYRKVRCVKPNNMPWFDSECRLKRYEAIKAGHRPETDEDFEELKSRCQEYKRTKQRKQRQYKISCVEEIEWAYTHNRTKMWQLLSKHCATNMENIMPTGRPC